MVTIRCLAVLCVVTQSCPTLCDHMNCSPPSSSVHGDSPGKIVQWVAKYSSGDLPNPGIEPKSPTLQADSLSSEPPGKAKYTRVGSLSLFYRIFPNLGIEPGSPALQVASLPAELQGSPIRCLQELLF